MSLKALVNNPDKDSEIRPENPVEMSPDPAPGKKPPRRSRAASGSTTSKGRAPSKATKMRELEEAIADQLAFTAVVWQLRDPTCGAVLEQQVQAIAAAAAKLASRWDWLADMVMSGGLMADVLALVQAVIPLVAVVRAHHSAPAEGGTDDPGITGPQYAPYHPA